MKRAIFVIWIGGASCVLGGATLPINDEAVITVGAILQPIFIATDKDLDGDGSWESEEDFQLRRGRFRLGVKANDWVGGFFQTEVGSPVDGTGLDARVIDAYVTLAPRPWAQVYVGEHLAPANRQNITLSQALLAIDRPGNSYKTLTWGTRSVTRFATTTFEQCDAGIRGDVDVRDTGATLFGTGSASDQVHWKYYAGVYDGIQMEGSDKERFTGRLQLNLGDPEPGYYVNSTYLGEKKTLGMGVSVDQQDDVAECPVKGHFDYGYYTVDVFGELPVGVGSVSIEAAYQNLDLADAQPFVLEDGTLSSADPQQSQGDGFYVQAGYLVGDWQPWAEFETWESEAADGRGSYDLYRVGLTYYIDGLHANVKAGYEVVEADAPIRGSEDTLSSVVLGTYLYF